jgi:NAD(P)-dependent dehydrogenase (short-subunit alcohol dehydrogenase family)
MAILSLACLCNQKTLYMVGRFFHGKFLTTTGKWSIMLTGAGSASKGFAGFSVYSASKAAIRSFARSWTVDLKHRKIRVNTISPGPIDTLAVRLSISEQLKKNILSTVPLGRMGNPEEVAKAIAFLASADSSYITGIELFADGGIAQI